MIFFVFTVIFFFNFTRLHAPLSAAVLRHGGPVYKWKAQSIMDQRAWVVTTRSIDVTRLLWEAPAEGLYIYITSNNPTTTTKKEKLYIPQITYTYSSIRHQLQYDETKVEHFSGSFSVLFRRTSFGLAEMSV